MLQFSHYNIIQNGTTLVGSTTDQSEILHEPCTPDTAQAQNDNANLIRERLDRHFDHNQNRQSCRLAEILAEFKNADGIVVISDYQFSQCGVLTFASFANCEFVRCDFSHMTIHTWNCEGTTFIDCKFDNSIVIAQDRVVARNLPTQLTKILTKGNEHIEWHWYDRETDTFFMPFVNSELVVHFRNQINYLCNLPNFLRKYDYHSINELAKNTINDAWLHACDPIALTISQGFYQFANFSIRADQPTYTNEDKSLGWKLHVSVDPEKLTQAFNLLFPKLIKLFRSFKVINPDVIKDKAVSGRLRTYAQITIYLYDHPSHQPILPIDALKETILDIVETLRAANIQPGCLTESDARLQIDGTLIDYVTLRNDRILNGTHTYISAKVVGKSYNPANHHNPYREIIWHYQPYCPEEAFEQMQYRASQSAGNIVKIRSKLWYSLPVILTGMLREYLSETTITLFFQDTLFGKKPTWLAMREFQLELYLLATDTKYLLNKFKTENIEPDKITQIQAILLLIAYWVRYDEEAVFGHGPQVSTLNLDSHRIPPAIKQTLKRIQEVAATVEQQTPATQDSVKKDDAESLMAFFYSELNLSKLVDTSDFDTYLTHVFLAIDLCQDLTKYYLDEAWAEDALLRLLAILANAYFDLPVQYGDYFEEILVNRFQELAPIILASFYLSNANNFNDENNAEKAREFLEKSRSYIEKFKLEETKPAVYLPLSASIEQQLASFKIHSGSDFNDELSDEESSDSFTFSSDSESGLCSFSIFKSTLATTPAPINYDSTITSNDDSDLSLESIEMQTFRKSQ